MTEKYRYHIWLNVTAGAGGQGVKKLLDRFGSPEEVYNADESEYYKVKGISDSLCLRLSDKSMEKTDKCIAFIKRYGVRLLVLGEEGYPPLLSQISDPPLVLYTMGMNIDLSDNVFAAVVGTRDCTEAGRKVAYGLGYELAAQGAVVVSGLAQGIDAAAHTGALDAGAGKTVAVLGCGLDRAYPACNRELQKRILSKGMLISEFPPGTRPERKNFPVRNRIISGLSQATAVVECGEISGALITARRALKQGRAVCAFPGNVNEQSKAGNLKLLKDGAKLVTCAFDILADYELSHPHRIRLNRELKAPLPLDLERSEEGENKVKNKKSKNTEEAEITSDREDSPKLPSFEGLSPDGRRIAELLCASPMTADELARHGIPLEILLTELTVMEIEGVVTAQAGGKYQIRPID